MEIRKPKVSIIMATYNRAHLIAETLNSISNQTFSEWECLIIDDGGEDDTANVVEKFSYKDPRFIYLQRTQKYKKGLPGCRNQGIELARGEYIVFFDDDDIVHPQLLELTSQEIKKSKTDYCRYLRTIFRGTFSYNFDLSHNFEVRRLSGNVLESMITGELPFNSCQILWNKECFKLHRFNEELMYAEEWELYSRILAEGKKGVSLEKILFFGRKHSNSNTGQYQMKYPIRQNSQVKAALLVLENLASNNLFNERLKIFFLRMGFELNSFQVIKKSLKSANSGFFEKCKYQLGYKIYPLLKPIFYLKGKILKN